VGKNHPYLLKNSQTRSEVYPASCTLGKRGASLVVKRRGIKLMNRLHLLRNFINEWKNKHASNPAYAFMASTVLNFLFFPHGWTALMGLALLYEVPRSHPLIHTTLGRTSLDEWSARRRDVYLTTHTTDRHPCSRRDSNQQSQQASGPRPTP